VLDQRHDSGASKHDSKGPMTGRHDDEVDNVESCINGACHYIRTLLYTSQYLWITFLNFHWM